MDKTNVFSCYKLGEYFPPPQRCFTGKKRPSSPHQECKGSFQGPRPFDYTTPLLGTVSKEPASEPLFSHHHSVLYLTVPCCTCIGTSRPSSARERARAALSSYTQSPRQLVVVSTRRHHASSPVAASYTHQMQEHDVVPVLLEGA